MRVILFGGGVLFWGLAFCFCFWVSFVFVVVVVLFSLTKLSHLALSPAAPTGLCEIKPQAGICNLAIPVKTLKLSKLMGRDMISLRFHIC